MTKISDLKQSKFYNISEVEFKKDFYDYFSKLYLLMLEVNFKIEFNKFYIRNEDNKVFVFYRIDEISYLPINLYDFIDNKKLLINSRFQLMKYLNIPFIKYR